MLVPFDSMQEEARIWIYQADRVLNEQEIEAVENRLDRFVNEWTRHGDDLKGSYTILYDHFIILAVDESFNQVSGCSIDASTHVFQQLEKDLNIDLMNKMNTAFRHGDHINIVPLAEFQRFAKENRIDAETTVFNNLISKKKELASAWEVPAKMSWHKRYF